MFSASGVSLPLISFFQPLDLNSSMRTVMIHIPSYTSVVPLRQVFLPHLVYTVPPEGPGGPVLPGIPGRPRGPRGPKK
jgi:hypothetical protein